MQCPIDGTALAMSDRQGIEIDYCPKCRGVWLDRGELDKLIERSTELDFRSPSVPPQAQQQYDNDDRRRGAHHSEHRSYDDDNEYRHDNHHGHHKKKKESFLGDMFDF